MADEYTPLATADDVETALGRDLTSSERQRVYDALVKVSELFRKEARRTFTKGRRTNRFRSHGGEVRLSESPVTAVHSVTDDDGRPVAYTRFGSVLTLTGCTSRFVRVDYSFGDEEAPEIVRTTVAGAVAAAFDIDKRARAGMTQFSRTAGPYSEGGSFAAWAVGGQVALSPAVEAVARSLRPPKLGGTYAQPSGGGRRDDFPRP
ncbi:MAG: putative bacteriophage protein [Microbacterium sp.]|jgi:hypothetical protein|nr:putative bacteriophage protein [Microbacterium sp.]